jgi:hypothetical protein
MSGIVGSLNTRGSGLINLGSASDGNVFTGTGAGLPTGFEAAAGGGKLLQLGAAQSVTKTDVFTSTAGATYTDITDMSVAITPSATTSRILVLVAANICNATATNASRIQLLRDSTPIAVGTGTLGNRIAASFETNLGSGSRTSTSGSIIHLDAPSSTSEITYKLQGKCVVSADTFLLNRTGADDDSAGRSRMASSITVIEIGA